MAEAVLSRANVLHLLPQSARPRLHPHSRSHPARVAILAAVLVLSRIQSCLNVVRMYPRITIFWFSCFCICFVGVPKSHALLREDIEELSVRQFPSQHNLCSRPYGDPVRVRLTIWGSTESFVDHSTPVTHFAFFSQVSLDHQHIFKS